MPDAVQSFSVLDNPAWWSLVGAHAQVSEGGQRARRYRRAVSPIVAVEDDPDERTWADLADLVGPGQEISLTGTLPGLPEEWSISSTVDGVQLVAGDALEGRPDEETVVLGASDVDEMLALVARNKPGPFAPETYLLGTYLGIRRDGVLVAMAGERLRPPGHTEVSAVCTDAAVRGQGLATRLVSAVVHGIRARGEVPFLHTGVGNVGAIALYERLGFELRRTVTFALVRTPDKVSSRYPLSRTELS